MISLDYLYFQIVDKSGPSKTLDKPKTEVRCTLCFCLIKKGVSHKCNLSSRFDNLLKLIKESPTKSREQITASLIKEKVLEEGKIGKNVSLALTQRNGGSKLNVTLHRQRKSKQEPIISVNDMKNLKTQFHLSQNATIGIASFLRFSSGNRNLIEPNLNSKLVAESHCLDEYFTAQNISFTHTNAGKTSSVDETFVFCSNLEYLINFVKEKRKSGEVHLKFGLDSGGGFLKLCMSIQSTKESSRLDGPNSQEGRQKYGHGSVAKRFKDSGVKKLFILGLVQNCQENYSNVSQLLSKVDINRFGGTVAVDLKMANILAGIMTHSSLYPCTWCYANKNELSEPGTLRTINNIHQYFEKWVKAGSVQSRAKNSKNCINPLIIKSSEDKPLLKGAHINEGFEQTKLHLRFIL